MRKLLCMLGLMLLFFAPKKVYAEAPIIIEKDSPMVIVLDPGHGGHDPGAVAFGTNEKDLNLKVAEFTKEYLSKYYGVKILMTREDNTFLSLSERYRFSNENNADLFVSLHMNASKSHKLKGASVYISRQEEFYNQTKDLAESILENLCGLGIENEGVKTRKSRKSNADYYGVIRGNVANGIPAILIEHGYMDNKTDFAYMDSDEALRQLGLMNANAIASYYNLELKEVKLEEYHVLARKIINTMVYKTEPVLQ